MRLVGTHDPQARSAYQPVIRRQGDRWIAFIYGTVVFRPREIGFFIPATTANTDTRCVRGAGVERCKVAIQTNNVEMDDRGFVYLVDRASTGLHIVELISRP